MTSFLLVTVKLTLETIQMVLYGLNPNNIKNVFEIGISMRTIFALLVVQGIVDFVLFIYFIKLIVLHAYLKKKGISMYEYIKGVDTEQELKIIPLPDTIR